MFSEDFRESQQNEVELHGITAAGLKAVLEFAYTGNISLFTLAIDDWINGAKCDLKAFVFNV